MSSAPWRRSCDCTGSDAAVERSQWSSLKEWGRSRPRADLVLVVDLSFAFAPPSFRRAEVGVGVKDRPEADREAAVGP